jgi:hypothetical protein
MTLNVTTLIDRLKKRVGGENGLTNSDEEYQKDLEEALALQVNTILGTDFMINPLDETEIIGTAKTLDALAFAIILDAVELIILDRKLEEDVTLGVTGALPSGTINTRDIAINRMNLRRRVIATRFERNVDQYLYGLYTATQRVLDLDNYETLNRLG